MRRGRRGCLAGPVFAAAVILPDDFAHPLLNDSKQLTERRRMELRTVIMKQAIAWAIARVDNDEIGPHKHTKRLNRGHAPRPRRTPTVRPGAVIVDGNRFKPYRDLPCTTFT